MDSLSVSALLIRFFIGGSAVVVSTIVGKKLGEKAGGIFAAFPAVYLAALLTASIDIRGEALISYSILLSKGAVIGMVINIVIAIVAGYLLPRRGWKQGLMYVLVFWFMLSSLVVMVTANV